MISEKALCVLICVSGSSAFPAYKDAPKRSHKKHHVTDKTASSHAPTKNWSFLVLVALTFAIINMIYQYL